MHRRVRDQLEEILAGPPAISSRGHLDECEECRDEVAAMRDQAAALHQLRSPAGIEPQPGFYARLMERIEAQGAGSIWNLFFDSAYGRRVAVASMALALFLGVYLVSSEPAIEQTPATAVRSAASRLLGDDLPAQDQTLLLSGLPDRDSVLVNLVTYREQ
jgi:predicted anti-sigma-YlaC factor YlaD